MMLLKVGWRNIGRRKGRTILTTLAMGIGVALTLGAVTLQTGITHELFDEMVTDTLGHVQIHHQEYPATKRAHFTLNQVSKTIELLEQQQDVALATPRVYSFALAGGERESTGALVIGVDTQKEKLLSEIHLEVQHGRWFDHKSGSETVKKEAVLGIELARELKLELGQKVALIGQDTFGSVANDLFEIIGFVESGSVEMDRGGIWLPINTLQSFLALDDQVHEIVVLGQATSQSSFDPNRSIDLQRLKSSMMTVFKSFPSESALLIETWKESNPSTSQLIESQAKIVF